MSLNALDIDRPYGALDATNEQLVEGRDASRPVTFELQDLRARHERILELASLGVSNIGIAQELGITSQSVSNLLRSRLGQERLKELNAEREERFKERQRRIEDLADSALAVYEDVFLGHEDVGPREKVRLAGDVLDRAGLPKTSRSEQTSVRATLSREQIEEINARAAAITIPVADVHKPDTLPKETPDEPLLEG